MSDSLPSGSPSDRSDQPAVRNSAWIWGLILIPAFASFASAWAIYRRHGRLSRAASGPLTGGLAILLVALIFLFDLDWGRVWPVFLIIFGLGALLSSIVE